MSAGSGKVCVDGVAEGAGERVFVCRFLQARERDRVGVPFFARHDEHATWYDRLRPASFGRRPWFAAEPVLVRGRAPAGPPGAPGRLGPGPAAGLSRGPSRLGELRTVVRSKVELKSGRPVVRPLVRRPSRCSVRVEGIVPRAGRFACTGIRSSV